MGKEQWKGIYDCPYYVDFVTPETEDRSAKEFYCTVCRALLWLNSSKAPRYGTPPIAVGGTCRAKSVNGTAFEVDCKSVFPVKE